MNRRGAKINGLEPALGGKRALTGMEPALSREFRSPYGPFRVKGLEAPPVAGRRRPLVVLAEYDADTAQLISLLADSNGYEIRLTDDGVEAWRLSRALLPDLLVTNIYLSSIDGLELIRRIRADRMVELRRVSVLVMDVRSAQRDILAAFRCGADDYMEMPYEVAVMLRCWRRAISDCLRPAPLTALQSEGAMIRQMALLDLVGRRPDGLVAGLSQYLRHPDPILRTAVRWALREVGTDEALAALGRCQEVSEVL